ncbi:MAG: hypothetical protein ACRC0V_10890 [Fusobacteriaceae bacterium]
MELVEFISSLIFTVLKVLSSTFVRSLLTPFIGPFAWIVGILIEVGFDLLDKFFNVKKAIADYVDYVLRQSGTFISSLINTLATAF